MRGAVAVDRTNLVREVHAPVVISTYPVWENFELIDARRFPADFVAAARELARYRAELIGWHAGLRRLPTVRATGEPDDHPGWNRFLLGPEGERRYAGGYHIPSLTSRHAAPPGKHLLSWVMARFFDGGTTAGPPWTAARAHLDMAVDYLRRDYTDLDDAIEWSAHQYVAAPQSIPAGASSVAAASRSPSIPATVSSSCMPTSTRPPRSRARRSWSSASGSGCARRGR